MRMSDWSSDVCSSDLTPDKPKARAWAQPGEASAVRQSEVGKCRNGSWGRELHDSAAARLGRELCARSCERKSVVLGKWVSLRVALGVCRSFKKTNYM